MENKEDAQGPALAESQASPLPTPVPGALSSERRALLAGLPRKGSPHESSCWPSLPPLLSAHPHYTDDK